MPVNHMLFQNVYISLTVYENATGGGRFRRKITLHSTFVETCITQTNAV